MSTVVVMVHPSGRKADVRVGFSWPAFLLGPAWALAKRQWLLAVLMIVVLIADNFVAGLLQLSEAVWLQLAGGLLLVVYMIACGVYANAWHRYFLQRQGFVVQGS